MPSRRADGLAGTTGAAFRSHWAPSVEPPLFDSLAETCPCARPGTRTATGVVGAAIRSARGAGLAARRLGAPAARSGTGRSLHTTPPLISPPGRVGNELKEQKCALVGTPLSERLGWTDGGSSR